MAPVRSGFSKLADFPAATAVRRIENSTAGKFVIVILFHLVLFGHHQRCRAGLGSAVS